MNPKNPTSRGIGKIVLVAILLVVIVIIIGGAAAASIKSSTSTTSATSSTSSYSSTTSSSAVSSTRSTSRAVSSTTSIVSSSTVVVSSSGSGTCNFTASLTDVSAAESLRFSGCLTVNKSGNVPLAILNQNGFTLSGSVTSQYPVKVIIGGGSQILFTQNDTTTATFNGLLLSPQTGYAIDVQNQASENNSISISLKLS